MAIELVLTNGHVLRIAGTMGTLCNNIANNKAVDDDGFIIVDLTGGDERLVNLAHVIYAGTV